MNTQMATAQDLTAEIAFQRYERALLDNALIQGSWHSERDGRRLACGLGVLGPDVDSVDDCPSHIMPRWLAQMVPWFFDGQTFDDAKAWGLNFYRELKRLNGVVPFSVVHDWQAHVVSPLAIEVATKLNRETAPHEAVQRLHERALAGDLAPKDEWVEALRPAYANANAYAYAYADANANAYADADADAYTDADANADAYADANTDAYAYADANTDAYAYADANTYAYAYADANTYAYAYADANTYAYAYAKKIAIKRLADGMVECLARVHL